MNVIHQLVLSIGSNQGNSIEIIQNSLIDISLYMNFLKISSVYKTKPLINTNQDDFFNIAVAGWSSYSCFDLLKRFQDIELKYGRKKNPTIYKGPRSLDIDIVLYGNKIINTEDLVIPHTDAKNRQFVLAPLLEILPFSADPISKEMFSNLYEKLPDQGVKKVGTLYEF